MPRMLTAEKGRSCERNTSGKYSAGFGSTKVLVKGVSYYSAQVVEWPMAGNGSKKDGMINGEMELLEPNITSTVMDKSRTSQQRTWMEEKIVKVITDQVREQLPKRIISGNDMGDSTGRVLASQ